MVFSVFLFLIFIKEVYLSGRNNNLSLSVWQGDLSKEVESTNDLSSVQKDNDLSWRALFHSASFQKPTSTPISPDQQNHPPPPQNHPPPPQASSSETLDHKQNNASSHNHVSYHFTHCQVFLMFLFHTFLWGFLFVPLLIP